MKDQQKLSYIQGLRAFAILLVVCYHLMPSVCPNGFFGVDIFLVISGYFLIGKELKRDGFSLFSFLRNKALRILPPVFCTVFLVILASICFYAAPEMRHAAKYLPASLLCYMNVALDTQNGQYFAMSTRYIPTMHLWYVGLYMQSLLIFAAIFISWHVLHLNYRWRILTIVGVGIISFALAHQWLGYTMVPYQGSAYYWTTARLWEFCLGGLIAMMPTERLRKHPDVSSLLMAVSLIALIALSFTPFTRPKPHHCILLSAALGAALILTGKHASKLENLWNLKTLQGIGAISFSLYLVHWPFISIAEYANGGALSVGHALLLLLPISAVSIGVYFIAERPKSAWLAACIFFCASWAGHMLIEKTSGFAHELHTKANHVVCSPEPFEELEHSHELYKGTEAIQPTQFLDNEEKLILLAKVGNICSAAEGSDAHKPNFVIIGDSHARNFTNGMHAMAQEHGWSGVYLNSYVVPFWGINYGYEGPTGFFSNEKKMSTILEWMELQKDLKYVFVVHFWGWRYRERNRFSDTSLMPADDAERHLAYRAGLEELCRHLKQIGKEVILVTDTPKLNLALKLSVPRLLRAAVMYSDMKTPLSELSCTEQSYREYNRDILEDMDYLEKQGLCRVLHRERAYFSKGVYYAYDGLLCKMYDSHHCTREGVIEGLRCVEDELDELLGAK